MSELPLVSNLGNLKQICIDCGAECCKRYWITLVPEQGKTLADFLQISVPEFIQTHTVLYLQLIPVPVFVQDKLLFKRSQLPFKMRQALDQANSQDPYFFALPLLALQRIPQANGKKHCTFLSEKNQCSVYPARPSQCSLFPYVFPGTVSELEKLYPFCALISHVRAESEKITQHEQAVKDYFEQVKEKGLEKLWSALPDRGSAFLNGQDLCPISLQDLKQLFH